MVNLSHISDKFQTNLERFSDISFEKFGHISGIFAYLFRCMPLSPQQYNHILVLFQNHGNQSWGDIHLYINLILFMTMYSIIQTFQFLVLLLLFLLQYLLLFGIIEHKNTLLFHITFTCIEIAHLCTILRSSYLLTLKRN